MKSARSNLKICLNRAVPSILLVGMATVAIHSSATAAPTASVESGQPTRSAIVAAANAEFTDRQVVVDFADKVVIPTFEMVAKRAGSLSTAIDAFVQTPNTQTLKNAREAWVSARFAWEQTECFGFGPIKSEGFDANFDTWPIDQNDLKAILASSDQLTPGYVDRLRGSTKGFHLMEYILFGDDANKLVSNFSPRELTFLMHLGTDFAQVATSMSDSWTKGSEDKPAYRKVLVTAGEKDNQTYPTLQAAASEMIGGMIDSLTEVADKKIGKTFDKKDPKLAESRFSLNTLNDIKSNVQGSENVYMGMFAPASTKGRGLSAFVAQVNPALDAKVSQQFKAAHSALNQVPMPFEKAVLDPRAADQIKAAREAVSTVQETLEKEVKPLLGSK